MIEHRFLRSLTFALLLVSGFVSCTSSSQPAVEPITPSGAVVEAGGAPGARSAIGTGGAVASGNRYGTEAGLEMLAAGGNAVDAAVATALALAVTFPEAGNLGGGGFAVVRMANGAMSTLDFREVAPKFATRNMYLGDDGEPVPEKSQLGPLASGVPGSPTGLFELHRQLGTLPWPQVVAPAVRLARDGFEIDANTHRLISSRQELFALYKTTAEVWLPGGEPPAVGSIMRLPRLAATLEGYGNEGPTAIVEGPVAAMIQEVSHRFGGILSVADLAAYEPRWREPVRFEAYGWQVVSMPLPSSGGAILGETFGLLERLNWADARVGSSKRAHLLAEAWRGAYADRFRLGDPTSTEVEPTVLMGDEWLDLRATRIDPDRARSSQAVLPFPGEYVEGSGETTHLSTVDAEGNAVALTTTLNGLFGCKVWVPGFGFLNNEMDDFAVAPGKPNMFGLVQGEANAVRPGLRMLSSMSPTIAWKDGEVLALGGRGGSRIPTAVTQVLLARLVDGLGPVEGISRPRIHHQWLPDRVQAEDGALSPEVAADLAARGHNVESITNVAVVQAVRRLADGTVEAASDARGPGSAGVLEPSASEPVDD